MLAALTLGLRVKLRRTQYEHMFSALLSNSDIGRRSRHVSNVPKGDISLSGHAVKTSLALPPDPSYNDL